MAIAHSLSEWDEALFVLGVRDYDVSLHHPHPPGYPLFVATAKLLKAVGATEFRALQLVVVVSGSCLFPALLWLALEIGFDFTTAVCGAVVFSFLPNVWVYGGTAFSDVPATMISLAACAMLLRGRREKASCSERSRLVPPRRYVLQLF